MSPSSSPVHTSQVTDSVASAAWRRQGARLLAASSLFVLAACAAEPTSTVNSEPSARAVAGQTSVEHKDVAALRAATARFHRYEVGRSVHTVAFPEGCFDNPDLGAMGEHFLNPAATPLTATEPQFLIYEPQKNGKMALVGVEFIVGGAQDDVPPVLFGRAMAWNTTFEVWALHVWAWRHNPRGMYADWNPNVTCANAVTAARGSHH